MVELSCALVAPGPSLIVRYTMANHGSWPVFVADLVQDATFKQHPNAAYTALSADGSRVDLLLGTSPLPQDCEVEFSVPALYRKLLSGDRASGEVHLRVPIDEWDAYHLPDPRVDVDVVAAREITLRVGVVADEAVGVVEPCRSARALFRISAQPELVSCSVMAETSLLVRKRRDDLHRS
jgi:hypothetical protein